MLIIVLGNFFYLDCDYIKVKSLFFSGFISARKFSYKSDLVPISRRRPRRLIRPLYFDSLSYYISGMLKNLGFIENLLDKRLIGFKG